MTKKLVDESVSYIRSRTRLRPTIAIILGSGLGNFANQFSVRDEIETQRIPNYPTSTIVGHKGRLVFGRIKTLPVLAFQGRVHLYENGDIESILFPIAVAHRLGIRILIITNAAGGINPRYSPGDLMLITDHINLTFEQIPHTSNISRTGPHYDQKLQNIALSVAQANHIPLQRGVYCGVKGPSYEYAAEIEMMRRIGADAVGMSTVNEASFAASLAMRLAGISCITNLATGVSNTRLSHYEVTEVANRVKEVFAALLKAMIERIR